MSSLLRDVRLGLRSLLRKPAFTAVAVLSLGLGLGANTVIFTLMSTVLFQPIPVADPDRLIAVYATDKDAKGLLSSSVPNYIDLRDQSTVWEGLAARHVTSMSITMDGQAQRVVGAVVSGDYFDLLGVKAMVGRTFIPEEDENLGTHPVAVLSHRLWRQRFNSDPNLVSSTILLNDLAFTVVGIAPPSFESLDLLTAPDLWVPLSMYREVLSKNTARIVPFRRTFLLDVMGRLKAGVSLEQATAEMTTIAHRLEQEYPADNAGRGIELVPYLESRVDPNARDKIALATGLLATIVAFVLVIACANVANLLLARASSRRREIAVRLAIGGGRRHLIRQFLLESVTLAMLGGIAGLLVALWTRNLLIAFRPPFVPESVELGIDWKVLGFTFVLALLSGLAFGLVPALDATRPELTAALKDVTGAPRRRWRFSPRNVLVVLQVALSLVALIGSGLFLKSLGHALALDPGFSRSHLLTASYDLGPVTKDRPRAEYYSRRAVEELRRLPGVESVAITNHVVFSAAGGGYTNVSVDGQQEDGGVLVRTGKVGVGYFDVLGLPILEGRAFIDADADPSPLGWVIVNQTMARRFWPDKSPVGRHFKVSNLGDQPFEVVGVARDMPYDSLGEEPQPYLYFMFPQSPASSVMSLYIRTQVDPKSVIGAVRKTLQQLDPAVPLVEVATVQDVIRQALWAPRLIGTLLAVFGALALALALIGVYGVMAYTVSQRQREIGIRMAIGANRHDVVGLVIKEGMTIVATGALLGLAGAFMLTRLISSFLFGVSATDPLTFLGTPLLLAAAALAAIVLTTGRATGVNPSAVLKAD